MQDAILGLINPLISMVFATIFFVLWRSGKGERHVLVFAGGFTALAIGFMVFHYAPDPNAAEAALAMHALYAIALLSFTAAVCERAGQRVPWIAFGLILTTAAVLMFMSSLAVNQNPRLIAANSAYGLILALAAQLLYRAAPRDRTDKAIRVLFVLVSAQFFVRPLLTIIVEGEMSAAAYRASPFYAVTVVTIAILSLLLAVAFLYAVISDQMRAIRSATETDTLTGLSMRAKFESDARAMIERGVDSGRPVSMIVADIDHFKQVNDIWGHQAGDAVIAAFGALTRSMVRDHDICGRVGGEEFCILVWDCPESAARNLAERIRSAFAQMSHQDMGEDIRLTASFGVTQLGAGETYRALFGRADAALYRAKDAGRNRVMLGTDDGQDRQPRMAPPRRAEAA